MLKRIALLLALCLLVSAWPAALATEFDSGVVGGIKWAFVQRPIEAEDVPTYMGTATILSVSGSGPIKDYDNYRAINCTGSEIPPWYDYNHYYNLPKHLWGIEIGRGITSIGNNAFGHFSLYDYPELLVIPDTVTSIGKKAFELVSFRRVEIPDSVKQIGEDAFTEPLTVFVCSSGSQAYAYAKANGYHAELTDLKVKLDKPSYALYVGDKAGLAFTPSVADAEISYKVNANGSFTFDADTGAITATAPGEGTITIMNQSRKLAKASVTVSEKPLENYTLDYDLCGGKNAAGNPKTLAVGSAVTLKKPSRAGYSFKGWMCGKTLITKLTAKRAKANADEDGVVRLIAVWKKVSVAKPAKPTLSSAKAGRLTVKLKKVSGAKGYQIQYSAKKTFPKASAKTKNTAKVKLTLKAKSGKTWYVRVRAWKKDSAGKKVYGDWSQRAKVKVK